MTDRSPHRRSSLLTRLSLAFIGVAIASISVVALVTFVSARSQIATLAEQRRDRTVEQIVVALETAHAAAGGWAGADLIPAVSQAAAATAVLDVTDSQGRPVANRNLAMNNMMATIGDASSTADSRQVALTVNGSSVGTATIGFAGDIVADSDAQLLSSLNRTALISSLVAGMFALTIGVVMARRISGPLRRLADAAVRFGDGDPAARADDDATGEIRAVAIAFNRMADALAHRAGQRHRMAATIAHELRTPIAIINGTLEAMIDGVEEATPATLTALNDEVARLTGRVGDLETLSTAETAEFTLTMVPTNLAQVAAEAANAQRPLFDNGSVTLDVDVDDVFVKGDPARLRQIVTNLLSNALKFTPSGGAVTITVKASEQQAELTVDDTGPGIRPAECEHVFEPFWRGRDTGDVSGSGMGLAIVDGFVRAHGGDIHVVSQPGLGASFVVRLPRHA